MAGKEKVEAEMGSNLRGDYYFPTARKRYLPRIRKADEALDEVIFPHDRNVIVKISNVRISVSH